MIKLPPKQSLLQSVTDLHPSRSCEELTGVVKLPHLVIEPLARDPHSPVHVTIGMTLDIARRKSRERVKGITKPPPSSPYVPYSLKYKPPAPQLEQEIAAEVLAISMIFIYIQLFNYKPLPSFEARFLLQTGGGGGGGGGIMSISIDIGHLIIVLRISRAVFATMMSFSFLSLSRHLFCPWMTLASHRG